MCLRREKEVISMSKQRYRSDMLMMIHTIPPEAGPCQRRLSISQR